MIFGAHVIVYSKNAETDRAFFREVLGFKSVNAGHGWLIFALPPGEAVITIEDSAGPGCDGRGSSQLRQLRWRGSRAAKAGAQHWDG
jgi:hypothetical protein